MRYFVRDGDDVARFGGKEFVVLLRAAGSSGGATIQRLLDGWRHTNPSTTLSAGLAVHEGERNSAAVIPVLAREFESQFQPEAWDERTVR